MDRADCAWAKRALTPLVLSASLLGCSGGGPEAAYLSIQAAAENGDWGTVYDSIDKKSQGQLDMAMGMLSAFAEGFGATTTPGGTAETGRELFIRLASTEQEGMTAAVKPGEVTDVRVDGDRATLTVVQADGSQDTVHMLKEEGEWKMTMEADPAEPSALEANDNATKPAGSEPGATKVGTRDNPVQVGEPATFGDWTVTVLEVNPDAADIVAAENEFNDAPPDGHQFVMVRLKADYAGSEPAAFWVSTNYSVVGGAGNSFTDSCGVIPENITDEGEMFAGASVEGHLCFSVASDQLEGATLSLEESFAFDGERVFHALQ